MLRSALFAATLVAAFGATSAALAQAGPVVSGSGDDMSIRYDGAPETRGNIAGGGVATMTGSGDEALITYAASGAGGGGVAHEQAGRTATFAGSDGDGSPRWTYAAPAAAPARAGRRG